MMLSRTMPVRVFAAFAMLLGCGCLSAQTVTAVTTPAELQEALARARGGETIVLAPGGFGDVRIAGRNFDRPVTLRSADPGRPAAIWRLNVQASRNLNFEGLEIGGALAPDEKRWTRMVEIGRSERISFRRVHVHGSLDDDRQNDGWGIFVRDSRDLVIEGSEFQHLWRAILVQTSDQLIVRANRFHDLQSDGANFAGAHGVLVENNSFRDFFPEPADHADGIQFWTAGQKRGNKDVVIRGNEILQGDGDGLQGIFLGNELKLPSQNVVIENNFLYSSVQYHGIAVHGWSNVRVSGNTVLSPTGDAARYWIRLFEVKDAELLGNVADDVLIEGSEPVMKDNLVLARGGGAAMRKALKAAATIRIDELIVPGRGYQPRRAAAK